ncbi:MAG: hypothetical protein EXS05_23900 [Planctomycetaceae bacterium]|nr:hypothetical protein [Planctomycetaceae bacterium]
MIWPPDIADDLPVPRDDEPASLRQDIADELADHLNSAFTRELHLTRDEETARSNALDRFGDPRKIARKLWFDALKEKIMSQRLFLVVSSVMTAVCVAATGVGWFAFREGREINAAILDRLEALSSKPAEQAAQNVSEWIPVKVRLVLDTPSGPPAIGYNASLEGHVYFYCRSFICVA